MTINERIKQVREEANLSMGKFSARVGMNVSSISLLERGINNPSPRTIKVICSEFGINEDWLVNGEGEMRSIVRGSSPYTEQEQNFIANYLSLPKDQKDWVEGIMNRLVVANKVERE